MTSPTDDGSGTEDVTEFSNTEQINVATNVGTLTYYDDPLSPHVGTVGPDFGGPQTYNPDYGGAVVTLEETIGSSPGVTSMVTGSVVHLLAVDLNSRQNLYAYADYPLRPVDSTTPAYSYERWIRVRFDPPYNTVRQFRFWLGNIDPIPNGWQILWGAAVSYQTPVNTQSAIATSPVPTTDPGASPNIGGTTRLAGTGTNYTEWIVLQAVADPAVIAGPGPAMGFDQEGTLIPFEFHVAWIEN